jgi:hypothetical protein
MQFGLLGVWLHPVIGSRENLTSFLGYLMLMLSNPPAPRLNVVKVSHLLATCAIYSFASFSGVLACHLNPYQVPVLFDAVWLFEHNAMPECAETNSIHAAFLSTMQ